MKKKIYHGSTMEIIKPEKDKGKSNNDYGKGFYCTIYKELASQWACKLNEDGIVNEYEIDLGNLNVLYLDEQYHILNWLAILLDNRVFSSETAIENQKYIIDNYKIDYKEYDIIIGYRADDAYFKFVREFLTNQAGLNTLNDAMYLGELGLQAFIQSIKGFESINFINSYQVDREKFYTEYAKTVKEATGKYEKLKKENELKDTYIRDIKRGGLNENSIPKINVK